MAVGSAQRRAGRQARFAEAFGEHSSRALDLVELLELAWHDCYGEITPPDHVIEDIVVCAQGSLEGLIGAARLAVADSRDVRSAAEDLRNGVRLRADYGCERQ